MRLRIAAALALLAVAIILAQSLAMLLIFDETEEEFIDSMLNEQLAYSMEVWRTSPQEAFPHTPSMSLYRIARGETQGNEPPQLAKLRVGNHEVYVDGKEYHVAVREDQDARYILAYDVEEHESRLDSLTLITVSSAAFLGLCTLLTGYLLAGRLTSRLERLARRVNEETPENLAEPDMEYELRAVAEALDRYRAKHAAMLERERAFAANLSHELRTPLTGIRTDAELLNALPDIPEAAIRRGNRIIGSVDRINGLTNSLLLLARETMPNELEVIKLRTAIESVWEAVHQAAPKAVGLHLEIAAGSTLRADPSLLDLVLRNVLDNALRYSETGMITCRLSRHRLSITDTGPGFAAEDLERVFDRFFIGPRGAHGLGLALVRHVCLASGWSVSASNVGSGGQIVIDFGASLLTN